MPTLADLQRKDTQANLSPGDAQDAVGIFSDLYPDPKKQAAYESTGTATDVYFTIKSHFMNLLKEDTLAADTVAAGDATFDNLRPIFENMAKSAKDNSDLSKVSEQDLQRLDTMIQDMVDEQTRRFINIGNQPATRN